MSALSESGRRVRRILSFMHIKLHRTFRELLGNEPADDSHALYPGSATLHLPALLEELCVVILSEGGSGKTEEIRHATRQLREEGKPAFVLRLEHLAHEFNSAFVEGDLAEFEKWLASPESGWLLLDSIAFWSSHCRTMSSRHVKSAGQLPA